MRIIIKERYRRKISLWLPSSLWIMKVFLSVAKVDNKQFNKEERRRLIVEMKRLKKMHKPLVLIHVIQHDGDEVFISI